MLRTRLIALASVLLASASSAAQIVPVLDWTTVDGGGSLTKNPLPASQVCAVLTLTGLDGGVDGGSFTVTLFPVDPLNPSVPTESASSATYTSPTAPDAGAELCMTNGSGAWTVEYQVGGYNPYWTGVTLSMVGTAGGSGGGLASNCYVQSGQIFCTPVPPGNSDAGSITLWVQQPDAGGSDLNTCTQASPCATCQHALDSLAPYAQGWDTVQFGPGTYPGGCAVEGWMFRQSQDGGQGPGLAIYGTTMPATLDAGIELGFIASAYPANDGGACPSCAGVVNVTGDGGWTTNNLAGLMLEFTSGQAQGFEVPIRFNTLSQIVINGDFTGPYGATGNLLLPQPGDAFAIVTSATTLQGGVPLPAGADGLNGGGYYTILIDDSQAQAYGFRGGPSGSQVDIANLKFSSTLSPGVRVSGAEVNVRNNWGASGEQIAAATNGGAIRLNGNIFDGAFFSTNNGGTNGPGFASSVYASNNYGIAYSATQISYILLHGGSVEMVGNYFNQETIDGIEVYEGSSLTTTGDWFLSTGAAILIEPSFQGDSIGAPVSQGVTIRGDVFTGNAQAVLCEDPNALVTIDGSAHGAGNTSAPMITSANTGGIALINGCRTAVWPMTDGGLPWSNTPTPNGTDITVDGTGYSWSQFTSLQSISNPGNGDTGIYINGATGETILGQQNFVDPLGLPSFGVGQLPSPCVPGAAAYVADAGQDGGPAWCDDNGTTWSIGGVGIQGPTGATGPAGATGPTGPAGAQAVADGGVTVDALLLFNIGGLGNGSAMYVGIMSDAGTCAAPWPTPPCICGTASPYGYGTCPDAGTLGVIANNPYDTFSANVLRAVNDAGTAVTVYNSTFPATATGCDADAGCPGKGIYVSFENKTGTAIASGNTNLLVTVNAIAGIGVIAGPAGTNGTNGSNGATGATGPAGPTGPTGQGATGPSGDMAFYNASGVATGTSAMTTDGAGNQTNTGNLTANSMIATATAGNVAFQCVAGDLLYFDGSGNMYLKEGTGGSATWLFLNALGVMATQIAGATVETQTASLANFGTEIEAASGLLVGTGAGDNTIQHIHFLAGYLVANSINEHTVDSIFVTSGASACGASCSTDCVCTSANCCGSPAGITIANLASSVANAVGGITVNDTCDIGASNIAASNLSFTCIPGVGQLAIRINNPTGSIIDTTAGIFTVELHTH